jgi:uncharacterized SAM-binding protein YcdF (DUF218 family)
MPMAKQLVELLTAPLMLAMLLTLVGLLCRWRGRLRAGRWLIAGAAIVAYLGASPLVGNALAGRLERLFPPLSEQAVNPVIGYIVVLGSGYTPRDRIPVTAALDRSGLVRVVEAIRLMRRFGIGKLVLSGGAPPGVGRPALGYAELARDLDVPNASLVILDQPQNTMSEARAVRQLLGDNSFILVTSAVHMPRAVRAMRRVGAHPIAAPTGQLVIDSALRWNDLLPSSNGLLEVEAALHEYLGLAALMVGIG